MNNAILAFLESSVGGTLADLRRFLLEPAFRERFLQTVGDPDMDAAERRQAVVEASRAKYALPRAELEAAAAERMAREMMPEPQVRPETKTKPPVPAAAPEAPTASNIEAFPAMGKGAPSTQPPAIVSKPAPGTLSDLGRGGMQHKAIQKRLKEAAEGLGFRAAIEHSILNGAGSVDLALSRGSVSIACEITITTSIDQEVGNVVKCLKGGFGSVAVVAVDTKKLSRMEAAVTQSLGATVAARVKYYLPDQLIEALAAIPRPVPAEPPTPAVKQIRGYTVKKKYPKLSPEEAKAREDAAIETIAQVLKTKSPPT